MKKLLVAFLIFCVIAIVCSYLLIPNPLTVTSFVIINCSGDGINRAIVNKESWKRFWSDEKKLGATPVLDSNDYFIHNGDTLSVTEMMHGSLRILIKHGSDTQQTILSVISVGKFSTVLNWSYTTPTSKNPFVRLRQYYQAVNKKKAINYALGQMKTYLSKSENIYGLSIEETSTADTSLISINEELNHYPPKNEVYSLIDKLYTYAKKNDASTANYPYLNITLIDSQHYRMMVALPVNKIILPTNEIVYKKMIPGNFLTTTVIGGEKAIRDASNNMSLYFTDYKRVAMAIPFQVLVTNRMHQPDTSKWITKLYFPVM